MIGIKKHRGLKRYYKNLELTNDFNKTTLKDKKNFNTNFDNIHLHFDWKGLGNKSFKKRKPHLDKLFRHFDLLIEKTKHIKNDFQIYAILLDFNSSSDALFLHFENPNNSQFYFKNSNLETTTTLTNNLLNVYIENLIGYEKLYGIADEAFCLIYKKNIGIPFTTQTI